jgi:hypothetical protein
VTITNSLQAKIKMTPESVVRPSARTNPTGDLIQSFVGLIKLLYEGGSSPCHLCTEYRVIVDDLYILFPLLFSYVDPRLRPYSE